MDGKSSLDTMLAWAGEYNECSVRQNQLIDALQGPKK